MTRIGKRLKQLREAGEGALVPYLAAGDPSLSTTAELVLALEQAGADCIELGVPFSDPVADGPSIQAACQRALAAGATAKKCIELVERLRRKTDIPIAFMTYANVVHRYGWRAFARDAKAAGVDGCIISDLPWQDAGPWLEAAREHELDTIFLLAPTSTEQTMQQVGKLSSGFIYLVSRRGVTGARDELPQDLVGVAGRVRQYARAPVLVGFGISRPEHVAAVCRIADGAVVGSALIDTIVRADPEQAVKAAEEFVRKLKQATRR